MAIEDNLGEQFQPFIKVFRGLQEEPRHIYYSELGNHWTTDRDVAKRFSMPETDLAELEGENVGVRLTGSIVEGQVHPDHVIVPGSEEHKEWVKKYGVEPSGAIEKEETVRPGSPVGITGVHKVTARVGRYGVEVSEEPRKRFPVRGTA
jgi:hypothetical protein